MKIYNIYVYHRITTMFTFVEKTAYINQFSLLDVYVICILLTVMARLGKYIFTGMLIKIILA